MIHKLYVNIAGWSKLDVHFDKKEIIGTLVADNKRTKHDYYMIVSEDDHVPPIIPPEWTVLRSQEEIDGYLQAYEERQRLDNMSVLELKKYMVKKINPRKI